MTESVKHRIIALVLTAIVFVAALLWLILTRLSYDSLLGVEYDKIDDSTPLLLAEEYVEVEMIEPPMMEGGGDEIDEGASAPPAETHDVVNQGTPAPAPTPIVTSPQPSPVPIRQVEKPMTPTGPSQSEIEAKKAKEKKQQEASEKINSRVSFGNTPGATGTGDGTSGAGSGNSSEKRSYTGVVSGAVGGRGVTVSDKIVSKVPGKVVVRINVAPDGHVKSADIVATGTTIGAEDVRNKCKVAALNGKVGKSDKNSDESGRITFTFK